MIYRVNETCSCGATFTYSSDYSRFSERVATEWRMQHRHEFPGEVLQTVDGEVIGQFVETPDGVEFRDAPPPPPPEGRPDTGGVSR